MRTTLVIDDDVLEAARSLARADGQTIGAMVSTLARRGLQGTTHISRRSGIPVFDVSADSAPITSEMVRRAQAAGFAGCAR